MSKKSLFLLALASLFFNDAFPQTNLIEDPGAESNPTAHNWTIVTKGSDCYTGSNWRIQGDQNGFPPANSGNYIFYSGCDDVNGEIYQDVDVSSYATTIDAGAQPFEFTGWMQVFGQTPPDRSQIIVEYRDASNTVLTSYNSGERSDINVWTKYSSTITAPSGTRTIRVRLLSFVGTGPSVDAYFDDLSLIHLRNPPPWAVVMY